MVRLNLSLGDVGNCDGTTALVKKGVLNLAYMQGLSFEKLKQPGKFRGSKTRKSARKAFKTRGGNEF